MSENSFLARLKASTAGAGSKKILIFAGSAVALAIVYAMIPSDPPPVAPSVVVGAPRAAVTTQGGSNLTPAYRETLGQADEMRKTDAVTKGGSYLPTVTAGTDDEKLDILIEDPEKEPPAPPALEPPRPPLIEQRPVIVPQPVQTVPIVTPMTPVQTQQDTQRLSEYMGTIGRRPLVPADVQVMYSGEQTNTSRVPEQSAPAAPSSSLQGQPASRIQLPLTGTIVYAQLVGRANSDAPGPVLAKILQGPLAGATLVGSFSTGRDALIIKFNRMSVGTDRDGNEINETIDIDTVAVDTQHIGTALATDVDRHLFQKIGITMAARFAEGFGRAVSQNNSTTTVRSDGSYTTNSSPLNTRDQLLSAGGHAIGSTGNILMDEFGRRPTTIIVEAGTPIGVLFL